MKEVKKEFLYLDEAQRTQKETIYKLHVDSLNNLVVEASKVKPGLTVTQKKQLKSIGASAILDEIRNGFQFKNATEKFNLDAMGLDLEPLIKADAIYNSKTDYKVNFKNDVFTTSAAELERIEESSKVYTSSDKQNQTLQLGNELIKLVDKAEALGLHPNKSALTGFVNFFQVFKYDNVNKLEINMRKLATI